ncbi:APC family permease [Microbacterium sp. NPDC089695]|uniref:APC family permease n=1 Tax=Microbacterium sp. NPDC089695 TaxID=3364198 RepID=UPI0037F3AB21
MSTSTPLRANSLGVVGIAFFVMASAAPIAAFVGAVPVIFAYMGPAVPLVYLIVGGVVAVFAIGYLKMNQYVTSAGGFVAYIAKGLGPQAASASSGIVVVTYVALQVGLWASFGAFAQQLMTRIGIDAPVWVWVLGTAVATTALSMRGVDVNLRALGALIACELIVVVIFVVSVLISTRNQDLSLVSFDPAQLVNPGLGVATLFVITCFTTFEATTVYSEEARNPRRTIPIALYIVIAFIAVFFAVGTWAVSYAVGPDRIQEISLANVTTVIFDVANQAAGPWLAITMEILVVTSFIAMIIGIQNMFARYCFSLGRAGVLPRSLARVSSTTRSPAFAALANAIVVTVVVLPLLWAGLDPILDIYSWFMALATIGWTTMLLIASIAIVAFFLVRKGESGLISTRIAPIVSVIAAGAIVVLGISNYGVLSGGGAVAAWLLLLLPLGFAAGWMRARARRGLIDFDVKFTESQMAELKG